MELVEQDVLSRSKASCLSEVKRLQCWGMNLTEVEILQSTNNLEILNLSCNKLKTLSPLKNCHNLQQLYLRKNELSDINEINYLQELSNLKSLWLAGNPITSLPNYRIKVLGILPHLHQLDQTIVSEEERRTAITARNKHNEEQSHLCSAVLSLLPLLDQRSLITVNTTLQSLIEHK